MDGGQGQGQSCSLNLSMLLECSICLGLLSGPVIQCKNGHNICESHDIRRLRICPVCRVKYSRVPSRNLLAERMVEVKERQDAEARILLDNNNNNISAQLCPFAKDGCDYDSVSQDSITLHEQNCHYRPINCCLEENGCNHAQIPFFDYVEHLRGFHGVTYLQGVQHSHRYVVKRDYREMIEEGSTSLFILEPFNQVFVVRGIQVQDWVYIWVAYHGPPNNGRMHTAEIKLHFRYDDKLASDQQPGTSPASYRKDFRKYYNNSPYQNEDPVCFSGNVLATTRQNWEDIAPTNNYFSVNENQLKLFLNKKLGCHWVARPYRVEGWAITITITQDPVCA